MKHENPPPKRVRIVLADAAQARRQVRARQELEEQTGVGDVLVRGLIRTQLTLALSLGGLVVLGLGAIPLLLALVPDLARVTVFGLRLPWLVLGVLAYPFLLLVGWLYVRFAERNERDFTEFVDRF